MPSAYKIRIRDRSTGDLQAEFTDFLSLNVQQLVDGAGKVEFDLQASHNAIPDLTDKAIIEVWRRNADQDIDWYLLMPALFRDEKRYYDRRSKRFKALCSGLNSILGWRIVNWPADVTQRTKFITSGAEAVMKTIVNYNLGGSATTANGRKRTGTITNFTVEASGGGGNTINHFCAQDNVLETLQKVALIGGGDFDVVLVNNYQYEFRFYDGLLGTDRSADVIFSLLRGNMANPSYERIRSTEKTVAAVWGRGEDAEREYVTRTGAGFAADNDIEFYVDARTSEPDAYNDVGDKKLLEKQSVDDFRFDVLQTPASFYGKHYFLGDRVKAEWDEITATPKIVSATISFNTFTRKEEISIGMDNRT